MKIWDITDKIKAIVIPKDVNKEDFELTENEKTKITEDEEMTEEKKVISDETEDKNYIIDVDGEVNNVTPEIKIKTVITTEDEEEKTSNKLSTAVKVAAGIGIAVAGIAAVFLSSKKRR